MNQAFVSFVSFVPFVSFVCCAVIVRVTMRVATWNVNGIRARQGEVLEWLAREKPDVVCLQEIKASIDQLTFDLRDIEGYWGHWHGGKGYSGVALLVRQGVCAERPAIVHPVFDFEQRVCTATLPTPAGDDHLCLDLRAQRRQGLPRQDAVSRRHRDVGGGGAGGGQGAGPLRRPERRAQRHGHSSEGAQAESGRRPSRRARACSSRSCRTISSTSAARWIPTTTTCSRGGRRGATCASATSAGASTTCWPRRGSRRRRRSIVVQREFGTSDHGPVIAEFDV